jgi:hypothetical protein
MFWFDPLYELFIVMNILIIYQLVDLFGFVVDSFFAFDICYKELKYFSQIVDKF